MCMYKCTEYKVSPLNMKAVFVYSVQLYSILAPSLNFPTLSLNFHRNMQGITNSQIEDILVTYSDQKKFDSPRIKAKFVYASLISNTALAKDSAEDHIWLIEKGINQLVKLKKNKKQVDILAWRKRFCLEFPAAADCPRVVPDDALLNPDEPAAKVGRKEKRLSDNPEKKTYNKILDETVTLVEKHAEKQGLSNQNFLQQLNERCNKRWGIPVSDPEGMSVEDATALIYNLDLSINKYQVRQTKI